MSPEKIKEIVEAVAASRGISNTSAIESLATETGIARSTIYTWLAGSRRPTPANARLLAIYAQKYAQNP